MINSLVLTIATALLTRSAEKLGAAAITCALIGSVLIAVSVGSPKPENAMILKVGVVNIPLVAQGENASLTNKIPELDLVVFGEGGFFVARPNFITMPKYSPGVQDSESGPMKLLWELSKRFNAPIIIGANRWWGGDGPFRIENTEADGDLRVFAVPLASRKTLFSQTGCVVTDVVLLLFLIGSIRIFSGCVGLLPR